MKRIDQMDFAAIKADPGADGRSCATPERTLFGDNCAACHGTRGTGGKGFPDLTAGAWLWGGDPETIAETLRVGINSTHDETRVSQMLAFGRDGILNLAQIDDVRRLRSVARRVDRATTVASPETVSRGKEVFVANCVACHGEDAKGKHDVGAPDLTDASWIYGGDRQSIHTTIYSGHQGQMPYWEQRLSTTQRKILTLYVLSLSEKNRDGRRRKNRMQRPLHGHRGAAGPWRSRWLPAGFAAFLAANAHFLYVAVMSQPDCVPHSKEPRSAIPGGLYQAAKSAC